MSRSKLTLVIAGTAAISAAIGYGIASERVGSLAAIAFTSSYLMSGTNAVLDVQALRAIHADKCQPALRGRGQLRESRLSEA